MSSGVNRFSRRNLLAGAAALAFPRLNFADGGQASRYKLREFTYNQVSLTGGPLADHYRRTHSHYLGLDENRLLKVYRQRVDLDAPGRSMGGWYDADGFVPGHLIGQVISGLSRIHANTGDPEAAAKARRLIEGYSACFEVDGSAYASAKAAITWPCYVLDKYEIGLLDAASLAGIGEATKLLPRVIDAALRFIPSRVYDRGPNSPKLAPNDEPYILPENLFNSFALTGDSHYLDLAKNYLLNRDYFDPLSEGHNVLPGKHGYSHVIALSSAAKAYEVLGDAKYLRAIQNAWDMLAQTQEYASGGWAPKETFVEPGRGQLAASLTSTGDHFETPCGYYAHSKLARYLIGFTGDGRYGDGLERILFNTILGALDPSQDGLYFYYSNYRAGARKDYYKQKWPCCAGTLLQSVADYPLNLYFWDASGIYVNFYAASQVSWKVGGTQVKLTQNTSYPESDSVELRIELPATASFAVNLRIPGWLDRPAEVRVNGKSTGIHPKNGFARIERRWKNQDTIELSLPFSFRTVPIDESNPDIVAVMRGPILLTAIDPPEGLTAGKSALMQMQPVTGKPLEFTCETASGPVKMKPFYQVRDENYSTYFRMAGA